MGSSCTGKLETDTPRTAEAMRKRLLEAMNIGEPYTAGDLAEALDEPRRTVAYHLNKLSDEGVIHKKKHSSQNVTWYRSE